MINWKKISQYSKNVCTVKTVLGDIDGISFLSTRSAQLFFPNHFNANDIPILNNQVKRYFNWISDKLYEAARIKLNSATY